MKKMMREVKNNKRLSALLIILLTVVYLISTAAFAQEKTNTSAATAIDYTPDDLSYGDLWGFPERGAYNLSSYALINLYHENVSIHNSTSDSAKSGTTSYYDYYGKVTIADKGGVTAASSVPLNSYRYQDLSYSTPGSVVGYGDYAINTRIAFADSSYGSYVTVPDSTGTYRVYVYHEGNDAPNSLVKFHLFDSYTSHNAYSAGFNGEAMTATGNLAFTRTAENSNWWYADFVVNNLGWSGYSVSLDYGTTTDNVESGDTGTGEHIGTTLGGSGSTTYYFNQWTVTEIKFDTLIVMQWDSSVQLGPISKVANITIDPAANGTYSGTLDVVNVFGESVSTGTQVKTAHAPLFFTVNAEEGSAYDGIYNGETAVVFKQGAYHFEGDGITLTAKWAEHIPYPEFSLSVSLDDGETYQSAGKADFYGNSTKDLTFIFGEDAKYKIVADFSKTTVTEVSYSYKLKDTTIANTLTAQNNTIDLDVNTEDISILFTITDVARTSTINLTATTDNEIYVAENLTTGERYYFIEDAIVEAKANETIAVIADTSFRSVQDGRKWSWTNDNAGYTIDQSVTLVLPYAKGCTTVRGSGDLFPYANYDLFYTSSRLDPYEDVYVTLTVPTDVTITNNGIIAVGGMVTGLSSPGYAGVTASSHSNMVLNGTLTVGSDGILSVTGYILGEGTVTTVGSSAAQIYQLFSVLDYMGGGYTVIAAGNFTDSVLFVQIDATALPTKTDESYITPFNRYAMLGIQANLTITKGNYLYGYCDLYANSDDNQTTALIIGDSAKPGVLNLTETASSLTASYNANTYVDNYSADNRTLHLSKVGRTKLTITGGAALGSMKLNVSMKMGSYEIDASVDTSAVTFPLPYNYDIVLKDGSYAIDYAFSLLPGASLTVGQNANLTVGGSSATRFTVYDGLFDHRKYDNETFSAIKYHGVSRYTYPNTQRLQAPCFGGNGTANLIVDGGTLELGAYATFGGLVQTTGTGSLKVNSSATLQSTVQYGVIGNKSCGVVNGGDDLSFACYAAGATVSTVTGRVVDPHTGKIVPLTAGLNYSAHPLTSYVDTFTYTLYTDPDDTSVSATYTDVLNAQVQGAWYNYTATITNGTDSTTAYFAHCADASNYYTDAACSTAATTVTANNQTYYYASPVARVDWADGTESTYYITLKAAVEAATNAGDVVVLCKNINVSNTVIIKSSQDITIDLNDYDITSTSQVFLNYGTLQLKLNGGAISASGTVMDVVYNAPGATMTITGGTGADSVQGSISNSSIGGATIVSNNSGQSIYYSATVRNAGTLTLTNVTLHQTGDSTNNVVLVNFDTGVIPSMSGVTINSADATNKGYAIYNLGGTITKIESCYIYGYYGIYNRNISTAKLSLSTGKNTNSNRYVAEDNIGLISTITDTTIAVTYRYGIYNAGLINSITGTTAISATGRCPIFNNYTWYYDSAIVHTYYGDINNDGIEDRTYIYDEVNRPTINTISGNITLETADYGIWNGGFIHSINGDTITITTTGSYGILNFWQIDEIKGKVTFNVSSYAIYNGLNSASNYAYAYTRQDYCRLYGVDDVEFKRIYSYTFGDSKIGSIGGASTDVITINATGRSGAIVNKGDIDLIGRGVTINVTYASNLTSSQTLLGIYNHDTRYSGYTNEITVAYQGDTKLTYEETEYKYANQVVTTYDHKRSTIAEINGGASGGIKITMAFTYANTANTDRTVSAIYNAGVINSIKYVTVSSPRYKIPDSSSTIYNRPQCAIYNVAGGSYSGEVQKISYYYSNSKFVIDTSKSGTVERLAQTLVGTAHRDVSTIGEISNCTISTYRYALTNYGYVGSVINSSIKTTSTYAIKMDARHTYRVVYSLTPEEYAAQVDFATDTYPTRTSTSYYGRPILDLLGAGNTLQSSSVTIRNIGLIREIDGGGTTKIVATSTTASLLTDLTSGTITNGGCLILTNEDGTTYAQGGEIGKIFDVTVTGKNSIGILNYSSTANYEYTSVIGELGEGLKVYSTSNYAVYSKPTNSPTEIRLISGGDYCGNVDIDGDGTVDGRDSAIHLPDEQLYGVMQHGAIFDNYTLSSDTRSTSISGTNRNCYYVTTNHTHSFTNGLCECGMFQFYGANVTLGNNLDMMFAFSSSGATDWTDHYVIAVRTHTDGTTSTVKYPQDTWTTNGNYYVVTYGDFAAKEMCDSIALVVCDSNGVAVSDAWVDSVQAYAMRMLRKAETSNLKNLKTVIVDMLNYGAAAQNRFDYGTTALANAQLSQSQLDYGSKELAEIEDSFSTADRVNWYGSNLSLKSNIFFKVAFTGLSDNAYAEVTYIGHKENTVSTEVELIKDNSVWYVVIPELVVADARCDITVTVYTDSAKSTVLASCKDSVEAYLARLAANASASEDEKAIIEAFMIFADSAYTYLHNRNG